MEAFKGPWGRMGGRRKQKEMERRKRKGRELSFSVVFCWPLRSHYGQERKEACPAQRTPHPTSCCPNLPLVSFMLLWLQMLSANLLGLGVGHQGPAGKVSSQLAKALLPVPHPQDPPSHALPHCCF